MRKKLSSNRVRQSSSTIISNIVEKSTSEDGPIHSSIKNPTFNRFDYFELGELIAGHSNDISIDVNNSFVFKWWCCK